MRHQTPRYTSEVFLAAKLAAASLASVSTAARIASSCHDPTLGRVSPRSLNTHTRPSKHTDGWMDRHDGGTMHMSQHTPLQLSQ
ncbi:MAG: hypothetical protein ACPIOQ_38875, partial [Promethearchaeia archaeon]